MKKRPGLAQLKNKQKKQVISESESPNLVVMGEASIQGASCLGKWIAEQSKQSLEWELPYLFRNTQLRYMY